MHFQHSSKARAAPVWRVAGVLCALLARAIERAGGDQWGRASASVVLAGIQEIGARLRSWDGGDSEAAEWIAGEVGNILEGWRDPAGVIDGTGAAFVGTMTFRALLAIRKGLLFAAAGKAQESERCMLDAGMATSAAMTFTDPDAILAEARSKQGRDAAFRKHALSATATIKATVRKRWEKWEAGEDRARIRTDAAFAREMVDVEGATSTDVVARWCREWRRAPLAKHPGRVRTKPAK